MNDKLQQCWEIMSCGREKGGPKVLQFGECIASKEGLGHSCWAIAGTLCGGVVQGTFAQKEANCILCKVYKLYNRLSGTVGAKVPEMYPEEQRRYTTMLKARVKRS